MTDLAAAAAALYALPPGEFVAARDARAREVRTDRGLASAVKALRRPAAAAWAVNALVRVHPDAVGDLLALGAELRAAQDALAGEDLRRLGREQRAALAAVHGLVADVAEQAGQRVTEATWRQVEATLRAAMADADAARAVATGRLVEPLEPTGFGAVELGDAVAVPDAPPLLAVDRARRPRATAPAAGARPVQEDRTSAVRAADTALRAAEREARAAASALEEAGAEAARVAARRREVAARLAEVGAELEALRAEDRALARAGHDGRPALEDAERRAAAAARALDRAREARGRLD